MRHLVIFIALAFTLTACASRSVPDCHVLPGRRRLRAVRVAAPSSHPLALRLGAASHRREPDTCRPRVRRYQWSAFVISGTLTGLAGGLTGLLDRQVTPEQLH